MKKILSVFVILACLCGLLVLPANAAQDPMAVKFQEALGKLDYFYDYDYHYMIRVATDAFASWENRDPVSVSAAEFDAVLHKHFVITDSQIQELRELGNRDYNTVIYNEETWEEIGKIPFFNEETQTYTFTYYGGFGGMLSEREYWGYVKNGETYDVYYRHLTYQFLSDVLPEGTTEHDLFGDNWPGSYEYGGLVYVSGPDGYYAIKSKDNFGRKYTVEMNGDVVRIISCTEFTEAQCPESFDDKNVTYEIPENSGVSIPDNECFQGSTTVKVEQVVSGSTFQTVTAAMKTVADKYVAYEFTATKDNAAVQPNGKLAVTFAIPDGYSNNVKVYYMAKDGALQELKANVDAKARTVTAELEHFSTYILADVKTPVDPEPTDPTPTDPAPTEPKPTDPAPTEPKPTEPQPTEPEPTDPVNPTDPTKYTLTVQGKPIGTVDSGSMKVPTQQGFGDMHYVEIPVVSVFQELGAQVQWNSATQAEISLNGKSYILDTNAVSLTEKGSNVNVILPAPGSQVYHRSCEGDFILDDLTFKYACIFLDTGIEITVDNENRTVTIEQPAPADPDPTEPEPTNPDPTDPDPTTPDNDQEDKGFKLWWLIPVIVAVVIAAGAVVIVLIRKKKQ